MNTLFHIATIIAVIAFFGFIVAASLGFIGGPDKEELDEAQRLLATGDATLVDVRTRQEYDNNGLEGAANIPLQEITQRIEDFGDRDDPIVLYCRSGNRSGQARKILEDQGFETVYDLGAHRRAQKIVARAR